MCSFLGSIRRTSTFRKIRCLCTNSISKKPPWNVLFFGADQFSLYSLQNLYAEYRKKILLRRLEVVTTTKRSSNPVQKYAEQNKLTVHSWPFTGIEDRFHVGLVVSFGHLIPESVIKQFPFGILNVHASLLPRWRGAAPIIYTLANGDTETGVTIMQIKPDHFDIGNIVKQEKVRISPRTKMPELHERLGKLGADCLLKTLSNLPDFLQNSKAQQEDGVTFAPKVTNDFAKVDWRSMSSLQIFNLERALSGFLAPSTSWKGIQIKLYDIEDCGSATNNVSLDTNNNEVLVPGFVVYHQKSRTLRILCANQTWISVNKIGVFRKKVMSACDFSNGYIKKEPPEKRYFE